jgi:hypothetical protein
MTNVEKLTKASTGDKQPRWSCCGCTGSEKKIISVTRVKPANHMQEIIHSGVKVLKAIRTERSLGEIKHSRKECVLTLFYWKCNQVFCRNDGQRVGVFNPPQAGFTISPAALSPQRGAIIQVVAFIMTIVLRNDL